jgi:CHAD domain-containing protein
VTDISTLDLEPALAGKELRETFSDERNQAALHRLRKTCKQLRYTLEVGTPGAEEAAPIPTLEEFQEALGAIHDLDIAIGFLSHRKPGPGITDMIRADSGKRHDLYADFCAAARERGRLAFAL